MNKNRSDQGFHTVTRDLLPIRRSLMRNLERTLTPVPKVEKKPDARRIQADSEKGREIAAIRGDFELRGMPMPAIALARGLPVSRVRAVCGYVFSEQIDPA